MLMVSNMINGLQTLGTYPVQDRSSKEIRSKNVNPALSRWVVDIGKTFLVPITVITEGQSQLVAILLEEALLAFETS